MRIKHKERLLASATTPKFKVVRVEVQGILLYTKTPLPLQIEDPFFG